MLVSAVVALPFFVRTFSSVTRANFDKIQIGMSVTELHDSFGPPEFRTVESGLVDGPETYITNRDQSDEERRQRGFRDYQRESWTSSEISFIVISDMEGRVVCRYSGPGQRFDLLALIRGWWFRWF